LPLAAPRSIESARDAHAQALHAARERGLVARLDHRVHVVAQRGPVDQPQAEALAARAECRHERAVGSHLAQARQARPQALGHVHRPRAAEALARAVLHLLARRAALGTRAHARSAPGAREEFALPRAAASRV
jgi:hypothetical protein